MFLGPLPTSTEYRWTSVTTCFSQRRSAVVKTSSGLLEDVGRDCRVDWCAVVSVCMILFSLKPTDIRVRLEIIKAVSSVQVLL